MYICRRVRVPFSPEIVQAGAVKRLNKQTKMWTGDVLSADR